MALRAMYKGIKKVLAPLIIKRPGELAIDQDALNTELNSVFFPRSEETVLGVKNVYPILLSELKAMWTNGTWSGNVYTDDTFTMTCNTSDGVHVYSVTFNGIFSRNVILPFTQLSAGITQKNVPKTGKYILNGVTGGSVSTYGFILNYYPTFGGAETGLTTLYDGESAELTINSEWWLKLYLQVKVGTYNNVTVSPMFRLATDPDPSFVPYAMTNEQLTASAANQKTTINAIITAATGAADFAAFKTAMGAITPVTRSIQVTPETREEITEPAEEPVKKTSTRKKSTAKADTEKEGDK